MPAPLKREPPARAGRPPALQIQRLAARVLLVAVRNLAARRGVNRYSHTTKCSSAPMTSACRTRFSSTYPPQFALRKCRNCAEMLVSPYRVNLPNSRSVIQAPYFPAASMTSRNTSRCVGTTVRAFLFPRFLPIPSPPFLLSFLSNRKSLARFRLFRVFDVRFSGVFSVRVVPHRLFRIFVVPRTRAARTDRVHLPNDARPHSAVAAEFAKLSCHRLQATDLHTFPQYV